MTIAKLQTFGICVVPVVIGCQQTVSETEWGTDVESPQLIMFEAMDGSSILFDQDDFISEGQNVFEHVCADEVEWNYEIKDSVEVNNDGTVLWRYVNGDDPVIVSSGYPPTSGTWDVTLALAGKNCYSSLSVASMSKSSGYSKTEEW